MRYVCEINTWADGWVTFGHTGVIEDGIEVRQEPITYDTREEAQAEIDDFFTYDVSDSYSRDELRVRGIAHESLAIGREATPDRH